MAERPTFQNEMISYLLESSTTSSDSSEDEQYEDEILRLVYSHLKNKKYKLKYFIEHVVEEYTNSEFQKHFRMSRSTASNLIREFEESSFYDDRQGKVGRKPIPANYYILVFLWFAGNKCSQRQISNLFGISESSVHKILDCTMEFLNSIGNQYIKFPVSEQEKEIIAAKFKKISGFPNVIGCIDGSYISIRKPNNKIRSTYINRQEGISITLQAICDADKKILNVFTGTPSKIHDARVLKLSPANDEIPAMCGNKYHILGDGAYPLREWMLTSYRFIDGDRAKINYNKRFCSTRVVIENSFGILKKRFIQLLRIDMTTVEQITKFIISCCILHNICRMQNDVIEIDDEESPKLSNIDDTQGQEIEPSEGHLTNERQLKR